MDFGADKTAASPSNQSPTEPSGTLAPGVDWTPAKGGGANFRTSRLIQVNPERMEFRSSLGAKLFCLVFLVAGLAVMIAAPISIYNKGSFGWNSDTIMPIVFGFIFAGIGSCMLYFMARPVVFDKRNGHFWKGWGDPERMLEPGKLKNYTGLDRIMAIQILSEYISGSKSSYYSYELNLVLDDGSRINVTDHGNLKKLREDARTLSGFLGITILDRA